MALLMSNRFQLRPPFRGKGLPYSPRRLTGNSDSAQETANAGICSAPNVLMSNDASKSAISTASWRSDERSV